MGNSFACIWAVEYFSLVECLILESVFKINTRLMVRFFDGTLIVWCKVENQSDDWKHFEQFLNQASNLNWFCEDLGEAAVFLDLEIGISVRPKMSLFYHVYLHTHFIPKECGK